MKPTPMHMHGTKPDRLLAGRLESKLEAGTVVVIVKPTPDTFRLVPIDTTDVDQLASFLSADQGEANSLAHAVLKATQQKHRRRRKA